MGGAESSAHEAFSTSDLMATYKAQFRSQYRCQTEDIYTYVETLQHMADLAWPFMGYHITEELVVDQFLLGMGNHEISMQVTVHWHRQVEDILGVARSLEVVQVEEKKKGHKPSKPGAFHH